LNQENQRKKPTITELLSTLREFKGIRRKSALVDLLQIMGDNAYEDAGVLDLGHSKIVVSTDGIVEDLVRDDPWLAGFYSVVVNVNDVIARGAQPLGYASILSSNSANTRQLVAEGIKYGMEKYGLKFLKGHTHPDTSYDAIDAAVIGVAKNILSSATAKPGDSLVLAIDLDGNPGSKGWVKTFDSLRTRTKEQVMTRLEGIIDIAEQKFANACKDVSGPGLIGTIAMLCESSHVGAAIIVDNIPVPGKLDLRDWLTTYPSEGFVFSTDRPNECARLLEKRELTANTIGKINRTRKLLISYRGQTATFINFRKESIFGFKTQPNTHPKRLLVKELSKSDAGETEALLRTVWSTANEYPEKWRKMRILTQEQILKEMQEGYSYFGIRIHGELAGVYKAKMTKNGLLGEQQTVHPAYRRLGLATAMYKQFIRFAREKNCKEIIVNALVNQTATRKILEKMDFHKKGHEYEQTPGMTVQMYEKRI